MNHSFLPAIKIIRYVSFFIAGIICICSLFADFHRGEGYAHKYQVINNLRALSKVYGYVRYFHPGDEAALVDWEQFLYYAVEKVRGAKSGVELQKILTQLFQPIAPTIQFTSHAELHHKTATQFVIPDSIWRRYPKVVAWQHQGLGVANSVLYKSVRVNRTTTQHRVLGGIAQKIDARALWGKEVRLTAQLRGQRYSTTASVQLSFGLKSANQPMRFLRSQGHTIQNSWQEYELITSIEPDVQELVCGVSLRRPALAWVDDVRLFTRANAQAEWQNVTINNPGFEQGADTLVVDWLKLDRNFSFSLTTLNPYSGRQCLEINTEADSAMIEGRLFSAIPQKAECIRKKIYDDGKYSFEIVLPLILPANDSVVFSPALKKQHVSAKKTMEQWNSMLQAQVKFLSPEAKEKTTQYINVIMVWNIFQHFYPYFDVVQCDWDKALRETLANVEQCKDVSAFISMMKKMVALVQDGHADFVPLSPLDKRLAALVGFAPITVTEAEGKIVVTSSLDEKVSRGDIIDSINGKSSLEHLQTLEAEISGSPQWKRHRAIPLFTRGVRIGSVLLKIRRNNTVATVLLERPIDVPLIATGFRHDAIEELQGNIYYLDMSDIDIKTIKQRIQNLAAAKGLIIDLRAYPKNDITQLLSHLTDKPLRSAHWQIPQIIYPDYERVAGFNTQGRWLLQPSKPQITSKVVFLTNGAAISYAESLLGMIEHYKLGEIIGENTAGANGNRNQITLPGGFTVSWTGMRVIKHDGSQHHLIGIKPTQRVQRTIKGITEGNDELFDRAIELINSSK